MNTRETVEYFHLMFCAYLTHKIKPELICLKGGCNLRFFFRSIRYSQDIDFDVHTISMETLKKNVDKILTASQLNILLKHQNIEISDISCPKQTQTTQRWKLKLKIKNESLFIPTKIEFSRRNQKIDDGEIEHANPQLIESYKMQPLFINHYNLQAAIEQKLYALILRTQTQARDVLDLKLLIDQQNAPFNKVFNEIDKSKAAQTLFSLSFDDFKSQVWPYLLKEYQSHYLNEKHWPSIQSQVHQFIQTIKSTS